MSSPMIIMFKIPVKNHQMHRFESYQSDKREHYYSRQELIWCQCNSEEVGFEFRTERRYIVLGCSTYGTIYDEFQGIGQR